MRWPWKRQPELPLSGPCEIKTPDLHVVVREDGSQVLYRCVGSISMHANKRIVHNGVVVWEQQS